MITMFKGMTYIGGFGLLIALVAGAAWMYHGRNNPMGPLAELVISGGVAGVFLLIFLVGALGWWLA